MNATSVPSLFESVDLRASSVPVDATRRLRIAGRRVDLQLRGLAQLARSLAHLESADGGPAEWTIVAARAALPPVPWARDVYRGNGAVAAPGESGQVAFDIGEEALSAYDEPRRRALYCVRPAAALPSWSLAAPFRTLFQWWGRERGLQLMHAAAIGDGRGAVLLAGPGGSGKSTVTIAALAAGLETRGDDYALVEPRELRVHALYGAAKLWPADLRRVAADVAVPAGDPGEKVVLHAHERWPAASGKALALRALLAPRVSGEASTRLAPLSRGEALRALMPQSLLPFPHAGPETLTGLARLVRELPVFRLELGRDRAAVEVIRNLLDRLGPA